jgi:dihydroneopterin aldolase
MRISLTNLSFFGFHGLYEEEKKIGNTFFVDVLIDFTPKVSIVENLEQTIDYVRVYQTVKSIMDIPTPLLETLVGKIANQLLAENPIATQIQVTITKQKLPIPNFEGNTAVSISLSPSI